MVSGSLMAENQSSIMVVHRFGAAGLAIIFIAGLIAVNRAYRSVGSDRLACQTEMSRLG